MPSSPPIPKPLGLSDHQYSVVLDAARPLPIHLRSTFLERVAEQLRGCELGDGAVSRACKLVLKELYDPPLETYR
jgi:hypothetical protein